MARRMFVAFTVVALLALTGLAGCSDGPSTYSQKNANAETGAAAVYVKDGPKDDIEHLYVSFTTVQVHLKATGDDDDDDDEEEDDDDERPPTMTNVPNGTANGKGKVSVEVREEDDHNDSAGSGRWITLYAGNTTVDLRALNGTAAAFLGDGEVPVGVYNAIRVRITQATVVFTNGTEAPVKVPSGYLHIVGKFQVKQDQETRLTVDFDLDHSLVLRGNGQWLLKPVLWLSHDFHHRPDDRERRERDHERDERDREERDERDD